MNLLLLPPTFLDGVFAAFVVPWTGQNAQYQMNTLSPISRAGVFGQREVSQQREVSAVDFSVCVRCAAKAFVLRLWGILVDRESRTT